MALSPKFSIVDIELNLQAIKLFYRDLWKLKIKLFVEYWIVSLLFYLNENNNTSVILD